MLEDLGLVVHLVPGVAELAHEPGLDEPVAADDGCGAPLAGIAQADRTVWAVRHEPLRGELLHHLGDARRSQAELAGEL